MAKKDRTMLYVALGAGLLWYFWWKKKQAAKTAGGGGTGSGASSPAAAAARVVQAVDNSTFKEFDNSFEAQYKNDISKCAM